MQSIIPASRPRLSSAELQELLAPYKIDRVKYPLILVGYRGYYLDTMGKPGVNDRNLYDDAIFVDSPQGMVAYNGNTDPSGYREGYGFTEQTKGMASLMANTVYYAHQLGTHRTKWDPIGYPAIVQTAGPVTVIRDGKPPYRDTGRHGINIHRGGDTRTGSAGCQTIPPAQWPSCYALTSDLAKRYYGEKWRDAVIPYVVLENRR